ncbi:MAG: PKD domain-containing protein [Candidatus Parabeggiatoa sp.]|nr:PKD domain-containing protein [Candidatus Parabeggiatoa sp.]
MRMSHFRKPLQNRFASGIQIVLLASSLCSVLPATIFAQEPCRPGSTTCQPPPDGGGNQPPQAEFTLSPGQGPAPLTVTFNGSLSFDPDGEIRKYEWQLPDGKIFGTGAKMTFTFNTPGEYEIQLIVTDNKDAVSTISHRVKVESSTATPPPETANQPPFAKVVIEPKSGPAPLTVNLNNSGSYDPDGTITSCEWQASNGQKSPSCNAQMTFNTAGTYPITLIVTDNQGLTNTAGTTVNVTEPDIQVQLPPTAQMSVTPKTGTAPLTVNLNNSGSSDPDGHIAECEWQASNGQSIYNCSQAQMTFENAGTYSITLKVTDNDGMIGSVSDTVTVEEVSRIRPVAQMSVNPTNGIAPLSVTLNGNSSFDSDGSIVKCEWAVSGKSSVFGCTAQMTFEKAGTYNLTLTVTDNDGLTATASETVTVKALIPPIANLKINPKTGTAPLTITLDGNSSFDSDGSIDRCQWQVSGKSSVSGCQTQMTFDNGGTYNITLTVTDNSGLTATASDTVIVDTPKPPVAQMFINPISGQAPLQVNANGSNSYDSDGNIVDYKWTVSNGQTVFGSSANFTFNQGGNYNITLTVTDNAGFTNTTQQTVNVIAKNQPPTAKRVVTPTEGNAPLTVTLNGAQSTDPDGSIVNYEWIASDGQRAYGATSSMTFVKAGIYVVSLVVTDDKGEDSPNVAVQTITVGSKPPVARFRFYPREGKAPLTVTLDGSESFDPDGEIIRYEWRTSDGQQQATGQKTEMTFNEPGEYKITLIVEDNNGRKNTEFWQEVRVTESGGSPPEARFDLPASGQAPFTLELDASESFDPDGSQLVNYEWRADLLSGEHIGSMTGVKIQPTFDTANNYVITLTVTDKESLTGSMSLPLTVTEDDLGQDFVRVAFTGLNDSYAVGETITIDLIEELKTNRFNRVDLWIAIQIPSGKFYFKTPLPILPFSSKPQAFKESLESSNTTTRMLEFELIPGIGGKYTFYAVYVQEGSNPLTDGNSVLRSNLATQSAILANE